MKSQVIVAEEKQSYASRDKEGHSNLQSRLRQLSVDLWIWEIGSLLLSACCVGAIMIILLKYDGKAIPTWSYGLTLNGVISVLAVIAKASMILPIAEAISQLKWHWFWKHQRPVLDFQFLDAASRGPWGCIRLLLRPRQWSTATVGAIITLCALLMEPSLQLIPSYYNDFTDVGEASVPISTYYSDYSGWTPPGAHNNSEKTYTIGTGTKNALYSAMFTSVGDQSIAPVPDCPTGNCTWPSFSSLAVCSTCFDVSSAMEWVNGRWSIGFKDAPYGQYSAAFLTYGPVVPEHNFNSTNNQTFFQMLYFASSLGGDGNWTKPDASQCIMWFCVKSYSSSVKAGHYKEEVTSSWPPFDLKLEDEPGLAYLPYERPTKPDQVANKNYTLKPPNNDTMYHVDTFTGTLLQYWLAGMIFDLSWSWSGTEQFYGSQDMAQFFYEAQNSSAGGNASTVGLSRVMDRVSNILTTHMRSQDVQKPEISGSALGTLPFVRARWYWAVLPVALVGSTVLFMAWTVIISLRNGVPVWKSSSLAVMVHGLRDDISRQISTSKLDAMERRADDYAIVMATKDLEYRMDGAHR